MPPAGRGILGKGHRPTTSRPRPGIGREGTRLGREGQAGGSRRPGPVAAPAGRRRPGVTRPSARGGGECTPAARRDKAAVQSRPRADRDPHRDVAGRTGEGGSVALERLGGASEHPAVARTVCADQNRPFGGNRGASPRFVVRPGPGAEAGLPPGRTGLRAGRSPPPGGSHAARPGRSSRPARGPRATRPRGRRPLSRVGGRAGVEPSHGGSDLAHREPGARGHLVLPGRGGATSGRAAQTKGAGLIHEPVRAVASRRPPPGVLGLSTVACESSGQLRATGPLFRGASRPLSRLHDHSPPGRSPEPPDRPVDRVQDDGRYRSNENRVE